MNCNNVMLMHKYRISSISPLNPYKFVMNMDGLVAKLDDAELINPYDVTLIMDVLRTPDRNRTIKWIHIE